jgi:hypothetical protein
MVPKYEEIMTRFERGTIGEEELNNQLASELPDPAKTMENVFIPDTVKGLTFGFANNSHLKLMKSER